MRRLPSGLLLLVTLLVLAGCGPNLIDLLQNIWTLGFCGTVVVVLDILALIELANSSRPFSSKALWALLIIFFPIGGLILYFIFGR